MIYLVNDSSYSQRLYIPRNEDGPTTGVTGHTVALQAKNYFITENGTTRIHPDGGYDGISGGTIAVYISAATGVTFQHLDVTEDGIYVPSGDGAYTGVTVQVYEGAYQDGYHDGYNDGYGNGYAAGYTSGQTDGYEEGRNDGYSAGYTSGSTDGYQTGYRVGYADGYASGHTDGYAAGLIDGAEAQKALMTAETFTQNGEYTRENGWSAVTVSVPDGSYHDGYQDGINHQKSLLGSYDFTANTGPDAIIFQDGISAATVNLPLESMMFTAQTNGEYFYTPSAGRLFSDIRVTVDVPQTGTSPVLVQGEFEENGMYTPPEGADGFSTVIVGVSTADTYNSGYTEGYSSGYTSGSTDGYSSGYTEGVAWRGAQDIPGLFTQNGTYHRSNGYGWSEVNVRVDTSAAYSSGYTDGVNYQQSLLGSTALTTNGVYAKNMGWSSVTVNVDTASTYNSGYTEGVAWRDSQDIRGVFTENRTYTRSNGYGWNEVVVRVPTTQVVTMTQAEYNALVVKDENTIYLIKN